MDSTYLHIDSLVSYPNNPFNLYEGKRMEDMVDSIREHGIISPIIVRPIDNDKYQILSGHNRVEAARTLGLTEIPAIIKNDLSEDEVELMVTESNIMQRSFADLRHSERAFIIYNHLEAIKKLGGQGKRNDLLEFLNDESCAQVAHKQKSRDIIAEQYALSKDTVMRYVRLMKLPKEMLLKVDNDKLKFIPAVELSWMSKSELDILSKFLDDKIKISLKKAKQLRAESNKSEGNLGKEDIAAILSEKSVKRKLRNISLPDEVSERLANYNVTSEKVIGDIISLYFDMLDRGEVEDVCGNDDSFED